MKTADVATAVLVVVGAINWGLVGVANVDLVGVLFGDRTVLARLIYMAVGAAGAYQAFGWAVHRRFATA